MRHVWYYMWKDTCTAKLVFDVHKKEIKFENFHTNPLLVPFGVKTSATWNNFTSFMEERVFPSTRANVRQLLKLLDVPYYDPYLIICKTRGIMMNDNFWIKFENEVITFEDIKNIKFR